MFHKFSENLIAYAIRNHNLNEEMEEEYVYGLEIILSVSLSYLSVLMIGYFMGMLWQSVVFLFLYVAIRRFAGGFHFGSQIVCYIFTCIISTVVLIIIKYVNYSPVSFSVIMLMSSVVLIAVSPVPAVEKPLDEKEKVIYGKISGIMIALIVVIYVLLSMLRYEYMAKIITVTICTAAVFAILGKVKYSVKSNI